MKNKYIIAHMRSAHIYAQLSTCKRRRVGCIIVKGDTPIAIGYNGTPPDEDNCCEDEYGATKPSTIHAEDNALRKLTRSTESGIGSIMFLTCAPCVICAPRIVAAGIVKVYYDDGYHNEDGINYLKSRGVEVEQYKEGASTFGDGSMYFGRTSSKE